MIRPTLNLWLYTFDEPNDAENAWQRVLRVKGVLAARARAARELALVEPEAADIAAELDGVRKELASVVFTDVPPEERAEKDTAANVLAAKQEELERKLLRLSGRHRESNATRDATPAALCKALPDDTAVVDFFRYRANIEDRYLAFVMRSDCVVHRVELGMADAIENAAREWQRGLRDSSIAPFRLHRRGSELATLVWDPLEAIARDDFHWMLVADGPLATVPFGALPTQDGYAVERHLITYLDRANDLAKPTGGYAGRGGLVVGGVDYNLRAAPGAESSRSFLAPCNNGAFAPLPGTLVETENVGSLWKRARRREPLATLSGTEATEAAVGEAMEGKALAHIATHGFFATGECKNAVDHGLGHDPMLLSGLVLAGANQPPDPTASGDGVLTAAEMATRDLSETGVVVLSACETGLGETRSGQGVLGLRRAFSIAGARTLLMSLWAIPDESTAVLMSGIYRRHLRRRPAPIAVALRDAQLEVLERQRRDGVAQPYSWAAFIVSGDWTI